MIAAGGLVVVASCSSAPRAREDVGTTSSANTVATGVDYSWARPSPSGLDGDGYTFACRYLSYDTTGKNLSSSEATALWAAGVDVVSNWEQSGTAALNGYSQGASDAMSAQMQAAADGAPADRPIYFSVDFDAQGSDIATVSSYFDGVASVIGVGRTGAYGGYAVIKALFDAGKITYGWQTYAWSYGQWDSRAQLQQVQNDITAAGDTNCCDKDLAVAADYGQWHYKQALVPPATANGNLAMTMVSWPDAHVELFAETAAGQAIHVYTTGAGDSWSTAAELGASSCGIASVFWPPGETNNVSIFDARPDGKTESITYATGAWPSFGSFDGAGLSRMSTLAYTDGRVQVFALGTDGAIWQKLWSPSTTAWSAWSSMGGDFATGAAPILWGDGHGEIFATDAAGTAWHNSTSSATSTSWSGWQALTGAKLATRPMPARWADGHVQLFARGQDDTLYTTNYASSGWPPFTQVNPGTTIQGEPSVLVYAAYGPEVFARDPKGNLMHTWTEGTSLVAWASDFNQVLGSDPFAWMRPDGQAEVFGVDGSGNLVKSLHAGATWSVFSTIATGIDPCTSVPTPPSPKGGGGSGGSGGSGGGAGSGGGGHAGSSGAGGSSGDGATGASGGCSAAGSPGPAAPAGWGVALLVAGAALRRRRARAARR